MVLKKIFGKVIELQFHKLTYKHHNNIFDKVKITFAIDTTGQKRSFRQKTTVILFVTASSFKNPDVLMK